MSNSIKCLMLGQKSIGKSTFLRNIPNSKLNLSSFAERETFNIECIDQKFEAVNIEIENCDVTIETCLLDTDLIINNKVIPSNKIINTCPYKVIILCFAMDDPSSFELIKSKWEIDLKKNKKSQHTFILLGLKSDLAVNAKKNKKDESQDKSDHNSESLKSKFKKRSVSINSNSSTSKLNHPKSPISDHFDIDNDCSTLRPTSYYKKFAKTIGSTSFCSASNNLEEKSFEKILCYDRFISSICKSNKKLLETKSKSQVPNKSNENNVNNEVITIDFREENAKLGLKSKIPKSLTAPLRLIKNGRKTKTLVNLNELNNNEALDENLEIKFNEYEQNTKPSKNEAYENLEQTGTFSIKRKLSRFVIDVGTYVVTCGGSNSRKLSNLRNKNEYGTMAGSRFHNANKNRSFRRKKSLLLMTSELSLNTLDNEINLNH